MHDQYHPPGLDPAVPGSGYRSLYPALFRAAIIAVTITLLAVSLGIGLPAVQQVVAQVLCAGGDQVETAIPWSAWCVGEDGQRSNNFLPWLYLGTFVLVFDVCVVVVIFQVRRARARAIAAMPGATAAGTIPGTTAAFGSPPSGTPRMFQSIFVNGRAYNSPEEMPPEVRQVFSQMQGMFTDSNNNGMPDMFEQLGNMTQQTADSGSAMTGDAVERLKKLKEALDSGLISEEEYKTKRAQILADM